MDLRVKQILEEIENGTRFSMERNMLQHGSTSVYEHSISVAEASLQIADYLGITVNKNAMIRGALLHDYFLYDWHDKKHGRWTHGFSHPKTALENAMQDFDLNDIEKRLSFVICSH